MTVQELQSRMTTRAELADQPDSVLIELVGRDEAITTVAVIAAQLLCERMKHWVPAAQRCQHGGCTEGGLEYCCADVVQRLCPTHARLRGYCPGCREFWAGTRVFDATGFCANCTTEGE